MVGGNINDGRNSLDGVPRGGHTLLRTARPLMKGVPMVIFAQSFDRAAGLRAGDKTGVGTGVAPLSAH
jgi:hypothetical protein